VLPFDRISSIEYSNDTFGGEGMGVGIGVCGGGSDVSVCGGLLPLGVGFPAVWSFFLTEG